MHHIVAAGDSESRNLWFGRLRLENVDSKALRFRKLPEDAYHVINIPQPCEVLEMQSGESEFREMKDGENGIYKSTFLSLGCSKFGEISQGGLHLQHDLKTSNLKNATSKFMLASLVLESTFLMNSDLGFQKLASLTESLISGVP